MYHSPVQPGEMPSDEASDLPQAECGEGAGERLREAHLYSGQVRARALFAPFLALTAAAAAALVGWAMLGHVPGALIAAWGAAVGLANYYVLRETMTDSAADVPRLGSQWRPIAEAISLAALWASLPTYAFATQPPQVQVVIGGAMGAMIISALALAAVPAAAMAFVATLTGAFCFSFFVGSQTVEPKLGLAFLGVAAVAVFAVSRISRWTYSQLQALAQVRAQAEQVRLLLREYEQRGAGWLWQVDSENRITYISPRMAALLGRPVGQLGGQSLPAALGGHAVLGQTLLARRPFSQLEMELKTRQGARWISLAGDPVIDIAGEFQGFRGVGSDVTEVRTTKERLTSLANMDLLSGLSNRARVRQLLGEALSGAEHGGSPCAVLFLDLDEFKPVNDRFGHPKGDRVLKSVAERLVREVGESGHVGRMGGDEFAVVMCDVHNRRIVEDMGRRIIRAVAAPFMLDKTEIRIGVSIGCAFGPTDGQSVDDLIQKADLALYQAKRQGGGALCCFNADMQNKAEDRQQLERDLREGIAAGHFRLLYQPLIDSGSQRLLGFEALLRWHHPTRGIVPPIDFIPLAEETGAIVPLGDWVIREACRAASQWSSDISVAVNVSARQLVSPGLPGSIREALSRYKLPANRLEVEVTESVFMGDSQAAIEMLKRLRALGIGIALDDFGTGYSSLGYLNKAVFHKLKIDGSFVRDAATNKETVAIIQSIVALAKSFRMTVTAEGVETSGDFTRMRDLGCHQIQGYLFGRPMSLEDASALVRNGEERRSA
ncbi:MAG TPA: EAL domain-containing protein [Allosphingosinicella sp.]|jgi:diguanylate cyclase (GGDEF)-like protein